MRADVRRNTGTEAVLPVARGEDSPQDRLPWYRNCDPLLTHTTPCRAEQPVGMRRPFSFLPGSAHAPCASGTKEDFGGNLPSRWRSFRMSPPPATGPWVGSVLLLAAAGPKVKAGDVAV